MRKCRRSNLLYDRREDHVESCRIGSFISDREHRRRVLENCRRARLNKDPRFDRLILQESTRSCSARRDVLIVAHKLSVPSWLAPGSINANIDHGTDPRGTVLAP